MTKIRFKPLRESLGVALLLLVLLPVSSRAEISKEEFQQIKEISEYFMKVCPPASCVLLGVGRSPTPFMAYIQGLTGVKDYAWNFPLSNFKYGVKSQISNVPPLSQELKNKLYGHLDRFLPSADQVKSKSVLVIDYGDTGISTLATQRYLQSYYSHKLSKTHHEVPIVKSAAITGSPNKPSSDPQTFLSDRFTEKSYQLNHVVVIREKSDLWNKFFSEEYDKIAEFGEYHIDRHNNNNRKNPKYEELVNEMKLNREAAVSAFAVSEEKQGGLKLHKSAPNLDFLATEQKVPTSLADAKAQGSINLYLKWLHDQQEGDFENRYQEVLQDPEAKAHLVEQIKEVRNPNIQDKVARAILQEGKIQKILLLTQYPWRDKYKAQLDHAFADLKVLADVLKDPDSTTRSLSAKELGVRVPKDAHIIQELIDAIFDQEQEVVLNVINALSAINDPNGNRTIMHLLKQRRSPACYKAALAFGSGVGGNGIKLVDTEFRKEVVSELIDVLKDKDSQITSEKNFYNCAAGSVYALGMLKPTDQESLDALVNLVLKHESPEVRSSAAMALEQINPSNSGIHRALAIALKDPNPNVRNSVAKTIKSFYKNHPKISELSQCIGGTDQDTSALSEGRIQELLCLIDSVK